ncbi:DUF4249 domain-containing protein [Fulvivirga lutea]|uniref:DUF4249 domain-containing protein n=1 Tax=Fulvivirga lutea TaxID=2810512 RepID=A0A974WH07_9BACT|nr:DUF4249 domain-containing protein [Fulvivirga lutea]QSE97057.1 DUF4249 domain-containing protein [Fulvivirga lutea]
MKNFAILLFGLVVLFSCEEVVQLDLDSAEPIVVIEGLVLDRQTTQYVKISRSVNFYSDESSEPIRDANVYVTDGSVTYTYEHNPNDQSAYEGYYFSTLSFRGIPGRTYTLVVDVDGTRYTAQDQLFPVTAIDSLSVRINEDEFEDPEDEGYFYEVLFYAKEPQQTEDFYLFKFYRNDTLLLDSPNDIYFSDDKLIAEEINGVPTSGFYKPGDIGRVEMYSISNAGFIYYNDLINLLQSDGGMFGSPPVNPRNNISGGALGFFQCSSMVFETIEVTD